MLEAIVLGIVQGITEWLPISSEGVIVLIKTNLFNFQGELEEAIEQALFLHLGTFFAALIYFRADVLRLTRALFTYRQANIEEKNVLQFLIIATLISGILGFGLLQFLTKLEEQVTFSTRLITAFIGLLLLGTAWLQFISHKKGQRGITQLRGKDSAILGIVQGFAVLPGFSRSGLTVAALLLRNVNETDALKLSFLMSLPVVLAGNIFLNANAFTLTIPTLLSLVFSFLFGIITIHTLLKLAQKINFGYFVLTFGILTIIASFF